MAAEPPRNRQEPEVRSGPAEMTPAARPVRKDVPAAIRNVSFKAAVRGYDRAEVDAYVKRVNRVIAELEVSSSPRAAVRHALDRVGEQVHGILERQAAGADAESKRVWALYMLELWHREFVDQAPAATPPSRRDTMLVATGDEGGA